MKMKIPTSEYGNSEARASGEFPSNNSDSGPQAEADSASANGDFSEYLWMENEEEFDKQILQQLEEEALMEHCLEVMMDHERDLDNVPPYFSSLGADDTMPPSWSEGQQSQNGSDLCHQMSNMRVQDKDELAKQSTLNPDAAEFVPQARTAASPVAEQAS